MARGVLYDHLIKFLGSKTVGLEMGHDGRVWLWHFYGIFYREQTGNQWIFSDPLGDFTTLFGRKPFDQFFGLQDERFMTRLGTPSSPRVVESVAPVP